MKFSYKWLQSFFDKELPQPKKLAEILTMHIFEVERVEKIGKDFVLDIDILSNRADCLSHIGVAREIGAILNLKPKFPKVKVKENKKENIKNYLQVEVKDRKGCLRYAAKIIKNVKVCPSPKWVQERLRVCGLRPINNIVDATNYVMLETGQPLHAFDFKKIESAGFNFQNQKKIIVRRAENREKITTLDDKTFYLNENILVISDLKEPLAVAGIKGGKKAEIDKNTTDIILEAANFEMRTVRRGRQELKIITDASLRFEHQLDRNLPQEALARVCQLIQESAGGEVISGTLDFYPAKLKPKKVKLKKDLPSKVLGIKIPDKKIINILKKLEFKILKNEKNYLMVEVPTFRQDITLPCDLVEEVGRIYGLNKISTNLPLREISVPERNTSVFWENEIKNFLKELGFIETYNYSFIGERELNIFGYNKDNVLEIENPLSKEYKYLRPSLIPNLLKNVFKNQNYFLEMKIFELGRIFRKRQDQSIKRNKAAVQTLSAGRQELEIIEKRMLSGLIVSNKNNASENFYRLKGDIDSLLNKLGISDIWYDDFQQSPESEEKAVWDFNKSAEIKIGGKEIGFLGEVSSFILKNLEIKGKVVLFDIDFEELIKSASEEQEYRPISQYPAAVRDLAVLVPRKVKVVDVLNRINAIGGSLVRDIDLFDIYEGDNIPEGRKNLAFHIIYQAKNRTLTSVEIDKIQNKIIKELEKNPDWEVRK